VGLIAAASENSVAVSALSKQHLFDKKAASFSQEVLWPLREESGVMNRLWIPGGNLEQGRDAAWQRHIGYAPDQCRLGN
jgi:hypothetical protein